jgi:hypothetical protein
MPPIPPGGAAEDHPEIDTLPVLAAPMIGGKGKNTIRMELIPVACWKVNDLRFAFGSSFVLPSAKSEFQDLANLRKEHPGAPLSVFGHADPAGDDAFNKGLSGRRALAVYAVLIRDTDIWESLYHEGGQAEGWGTSSIQTMLAACGTDPGPIDGIKGPKTTQAIQSFQTQNGLAADGVAGPQTRASLFRAYMTFLHPEKLEPSAFLAQGADPGHKGDVQGCSEFNPMMVFSQAENQQYSQPANKSQRDSENAVNRRVMVLLFRPGSVVPAEKWPCPRAEEGGEACRRRFWSDGDARRSPQAVRREFGQTGDTFACRFYHRLVVNSPCEGVLPPPPLNSHWIEIELCDQAGKPMAATRYSIQLPNGATETGKLDKNGRARVERIPGGNCKVTFPDLDGSSWDSA